jgi:hypothetical protein
MVGSGVGAGQSGATGQTVQSFEQPQSQLNPNQLPFGSAATPQKLQVGPLGLSQASGSQSKDNYGSLQKRHTTNNKS